MEKYKVTYVLTLVGRKVVSAENQAQGIEKVSEHIKRYLKPQLPKGLVLGGWYCDKVRKLNEED